MPGKQRPNDGPGANGLRGGKNTYSHKTVIGNWQDEIGGPGFFKRGFTSHDFQTEGQHQQQGATGKNAPYYGAGLPNQLSVRSMAATTFDVFAPGGTSAADWTTNSQATLSTGYIKVQESHMPPTTLSTEQLEKYRQTWTTDTEVSRTMRYKTESRLAGNAVGKQFATVSVRMLPGTPKALDNLRTKLIERHGILGISAMKFHIGSGEISCDSLRIMIAKDIGLKINHHEFNQILAYFTPTQTLKADHFIRTIVAKTEGFEAQPVKDLFKQLTLSNEISTEELISKLSYDTFDEVAQGLQLYMPAYGSTFTETEFVQLHSDLYASTPAAYNESQILKSIWKL